MKAGELLREFRRPSRADDADKPYLYEDDEVFGWMAEAERQAATRARLLYDETTPAVCRIPVVQGRIRYALDHRIIWVEDLWLDRPPTGQPTSSHRMHLVDQSNAHRRPFPYLLGTSYNFDNVRTAPGSDYGNTSAGWNEALQSGNRLHEASVDGYSLVLYTIPDQSFATGQAPATLRICVYRVPLCPIRKAEDCFEIPEVHQDGLIHWLMYKAGLGQSAEEEQRARSAQSLAEFTARFGEMPSASVIQQQNEGNSSRMVYAGY